MPEYTETMGGSGPVGNSGARGRSGEHVMTQQELIASTVATALAAALPQALDRIRDESSDRHAMKELQTSINTSLREMRLDNKATSDALGGKIDAIRTELADGTVTFREHKFRIERVEQRLDEHSDAYRRGVPIPTPTPMTHPQVGGSSGLVAARREKDKAKDAPLISPKVWNTLILAIVGALGTGLGALGWEKIRGPDKAQVTTTTTTTMSATVPQPTVPSPAGHQPVATQPPVAVGGP